MMKAGECIAMGKVCRLEQVEQELSLFQNIMITKFDIGIWGLCLRSERAIACIDKACCWFHAIPTSKGVTDYGISILYVIKDH